MRIKRRKTRTIYVGSVPIGGVHAVSVQSMAKTDTRDALRTAREIKRLERAGCDIVRVAVPDAAAAKAISRIKRKIRIPLAADIHFDYRLAVLAMENGADKIRLNPGNITDKAQIARIARQARKRKIPIRIGLNSGSVRRTGGTNRLAGDMVNAALAYEKLLRKFDFYDVIFSLKTPDVLTTIEAYRRIAAMTDAPLHLGMTAAGPPEHGIVKSGIGIGALLLEGIGDTMRVSLTADPVLEVQTAKEILSALKLRRGSIEIISCPACGRCTIDLIAVVRRMEERFNVVRDEFSDRSLTVAIMGCVVNGPGEAKDADIGMAWGGRAGILFKKGKKVKTVNRDNLEDVLFSEVKHEMVTAAAADA